MVSGIGLNANVTMPVRYVFVRAVDPAGNWLRSSPRHSFVARLNGRSPDGSACRHRMEVLDLHDGRVVVRFRLVSTCLSAQLEIYYANQPVAGSPFRFAEPIQAEECSCPSGTLSDWIAAAQCAPLPHVEAELERYRGLDFNNVLNRTVTLFNKPYAQSYCHYNVRQNKVYRKCYGKYPGFSMFVDALLYSLSRKAVLPDTEFLFNLGDWPLIKSASKLSIPMFSWCGSTDTDDLTVPTYDLTGSTLDAMSRVTLDMISVQSVEWLPWHQRKSQGFWRGRDSCHERLRLIEISRQHPELIDAAITHFFFFKDQIDKYGPTKERVSFFQFFNYKYQISIDGTVAAYRFPYLLAGGSLVFKQKSKYHEHFYRHLKPGVHYVEVRADLSDLVDKLLWARENDNQARAIAEAGRAAAQELLMPQHVMCHHAIILQTWSQFSLSTPESPRADMQLAEDEAYQHRVGQCQCHLTATRHDEL